MNINFIFFFNLTLFIIGITGIISNGFNLIITLMSIELMLIAVNLNFLFFSIYLDDICGEIISLFILTVAAAESAIGLAIIIIFFKSRGSISLENLPVLSD